MTVCLSYLQLSWKL